MMLLYKIGEEMLERRPSEELTEFERFVGDVTRAAWPVARDAGLIRITLKYMYGPEFEAGRFGTAERYDEWIEGVWGEVVDFMHAMVEDSELESKHVLLGSPAGYLYMVKL